MLKVGDKLPEFKLTATVDMDINKAFTEITHVSYPGKWLILFFWPKDFTFVCPTEIVYVDKEISAETMENLKKVTRCC